MNELLLATYLELVEPSPSEMIESVHLTDHHKDPFGRLLIIQARTHNAYLVSRDRQLALYEVPVFWKD